MILTIWRHGEAGSAASDYERGLTSRGCEEISLGASRFAGHCKQRSIPSPRVIAYSPWVRTTATGRLLGEEFASAERLPCEALQPGSNVPRVDTYVEGYGLEDGVTQHLLLVSHQPLVSRLVDHYLGELGRVPPLTPGGLASLSLLAPGQGCGELLFWSLPPEYQSVL